jgi:hypothetical protein
MISFFAELFKKMNKWHVSSLKWDETKLKSYYKSVMKRIEFLSRKGGNFFLLNLEMYKKLFLYAGNYLKSV